MSMTRLKLHYKSSTGSGTSVSKTLKPKSEQTSMTSFHRFLPWKVITEDLLGLQAPLFLICNLQTQVLCYYPALPPHAKGYWSAKALQTSKSCGICMCSTAWASSCQITSNCSQMYPSRSTQLQRGKNSCACCKCHIELFQDTLPHTS